MTTPAAGQLMLLPQLSLPAVLTLSSWLLGVLALLRAIEWPPPDLRLLRLWKLAGRQQTLTAGLWLRQQLLCLGMARWLLHWQARRRVRRLRRELPALVDRLCIALGCGLDWPAALQLAGETPAGRDICMLLQRRTLLAPAPLALLARELRHEIDALDCLLRWSQRQGIAAYDLRHEPHRMPRPVVGPAAGRLQRQFDAQHPGHAGTASHRGRAAAERADRPAAGARGRGGGGGTVAGRARQRHADRGS